MPNRNYRNGRAFEYRVMRDLEGLGYWCMRSAGSHGHADVVALRRGRRPMLVQCKGGGVDGPKKRMALAALADSVEAYPVVADSPKRGMIRYRSVCSENGALVGLEFPDTSPAPSSLPPAKVIP